MTRITIEPPRPTVDTSLRIGLDGLPAGERAGALGGRIGTPAELERHLRDPCGRE